MGWLALTLEVQAAEAEAMSEALLEAGAESVALERLDSPRPELHALFKPQADAAACVHLAAQALGKSQPPAYSIHLLADEDWVRKTQAQFSPLEIGARLWVGASWHEPPAGRLVVRIDPGLAFGTGTHPSTRLMLEYLERELRGGESVLDYGCGSGILAIAAARLGASRADGVDVDLQSVQTAKDNARANGVAIRAALPDELPVWRYDVVVANILAQPLIVLAPLLAAHTARGGRLALSGLLDSQAREVIEAYAPWVPLGICGRQEAWVALAGVRA